MSVVSFNATLHRHVFRDNAFQFIWYVLSRKLVFYVHVHFVHCAFFIIVSGSL